MDWTIAFIDGVSEYGYWALFICCAIGLFIFPVPNEVLLMTGGWLVTATYLEPIPAFLLIYTAVLCHGSVWYVLGTKIEKFSDQSKKIPQKWKQRLGESSEIVNRYGKKALLVSYFIPFIRHAVPLGVGASSISYYKFASYAFTSAAIWVTIYFSLGYFFGQLIGQIQTYIEQFSYVVIVMLLLIGFYGIRKWKKISPEKVIN
ncbi:DedA family protein [Alkalicoccobacillus plakortidis]|uniref:DedA family protein n=1 Tax=Alkalicoccobacillus plakortidis TaxID=444060 RepID=A0ABT0XFC2_9BACI|nr:DedA family protein [Alkalicoccobacillus plakortidis]MCM2674588.1 DedA family protein [Alkalicoccobacillus plakortidis]